MTISLYFYALIWIIFNDNKKSSKPVSRILFPECLRMPVFHHLSCRSTPRYQASSPQAPVYVIFQRVRRTAGDVAITAGRLLPCLLTLTRLGRGFGGRLFSSPLLCPHGHLPFRKYDALCCPDFPPLSCIRICMKRAMERSTAFYLLLNEPWLLQIHIPGMRHPETRIQDIFPVILFLSAFSGFPVPPRVL